MGVCDLCPRRFRPGPLRPIRTSMGGHHRPRLGGWAVLLCLLVQAGKASGKESPCVQGFKAEQYSFTVDGRELEPGTVLGKVAFSDCAGLNGVLYVNEDEFTVQPDGIVSVNRHIVLHGRQRIFYINSWDESGKTSSTIVTLRLQRHPPHPHHPLPHHHPHHHPPPHHHHHPDHEKHSLPGNHTERQVVFFPKAQQGLHRQKRDWVIPPMSVSENERGPFPKNLVQIKSNKDKETTVYYSLTGPGADEPPVGIFTIVRNTGWMQVTRPLDREACPVYTVFSHAVSQDGIKVEDPMELIIRVTDQNDNKPVFVEEVFKGQVPEGSQPGTSVMQVIATDADDSVDTNNGVVQYKILDQEPKVPNEHMFTINKVTGQISVISTGLDRELIPKYVLILQATDMEGAGYSTTGTAMIEVTDTNDNAPQFDPAVYTATVPENRIGFECLKLTVIDLDAAHTQAWNAEYKIIKGNDGGSFNITTDSANNQGILTTVKGLDFETKKQYILLISAVNQIPFSFSLPTSTATVTVNVEDDNEAPIFDPQTKEVEVRENLIKGARITTYTAQDPDKMQDQTITYRIDEDPAEWLSITPDTGIVTGNGNLDREAKDYLENDVYKATILAIDNGTPQLTGTGTLLIRLLDVNDNGPEPDPRTFQICIQNQEPHTLKIVDADIEPNTFPYKVELSHESRENWTAEVSDKSLIITPLRELERMSYTIAVTLSDSGDVTKLTTITAIACNCANGKMDCEERAYLASAMGVPAILGILGGILGLLILLLILLLFIRRKRVVKEPLLPPEDDTRDNVYYYDEEGGGEEDQDYDLSQLHRGLDARPDVMRNDVVPTLAAAPQYRPRPANPDEIGNFIDENLKAADTDPTAPPYDSLLVFDYEGSGSQAVSLSSLNSSNSDVDQDYNCLNEWGPRFRKLADMYGGDEE